MKQKRGGCFHLGFFLSNWTKPVVKSLKHSCSFLLLLCLTVDQPNPHSFLLLLLLPLLPHTLPFFLLAHTHLCSCLSLPPLFGSYTSYPTPHPPPRAPLPPASSSSVMELLTHCSRLSAGRSLALIPLIRPQISSLHIRLNAAGRQRCDLCDAVIIHLLLPAVAAL